MTSGQGRATRPPRALRIDPVRFDDVPDVLRLIQRAIAQGCRRHYDAVQSAAVFATYARTLFVDAQGHFESITARRAGSIVGFAQLDPAGARLRALFVDAPHQGHGVGGLLLAEVEARARRRGCVRLDGAMSLNAVPFYTRAGFRPCGAPERLMTSGVPVPIVRMQKGLFVP